MLALTLKQPWPYAIARLGKRLENRVWEPSPNQLKPGEMFALHGGKMPKGDELLEALALASELTRRFHHELTGKLSVADYIVEGIFAVCRLQHVAEESADPWFDGPFGWRLNDVSFLSKPVPCRGAQKLWKIPPEVLAKVEAQL
jgi:hypothetical protein